MKKLFTLLIAAISMTGVFAQEWHIGANINNTYMLYEEPLEPTYHYGVLVNAEKGLDLHNQWRLGIEAGFSGSLPIEIVNTTTTPGFPPITLVSASRTTLSWIPVHALISYNAFEHRRSVNFRTSLALGYAIGTSTSEILPSTQLIGGLPVIVPGSTTEYSWGGPSFAFRLGAMFALKKESIFLNLEAGYHGIYSDYDGLFPSYDSDGLPYKRAIVVNGVELNVGVVFRIWKYNQ